MKRNLIIVFILFAFTSCATLPKETVEMSVMLEQQISTLETTTISITDKYFEEQQKKAVDFLDNEWYPYFLNQFFKSDKVITVLNSLESYLTIDINVSEPLIAFGGTVSFLVLYPEVP